ncbi:serine/threonine protein kinase [bacterium]|nr:serine/threonine protein kinase [bacterium]
MAEEFPETIGPYRVLRELGRGAMGTVYLARQESLARDLAVKVMAAEFTRDQEFVARFKREGLISSKLRHPNIVQVYDYSASDGLYYIAMEYVGAEDLQAYLRANGGHLPVAEVVRLMGQVLSALDCAHETGVTHRDVKPANILLSPRHDAVLTDFSIASIQEAQRLTQTGAMVGTPDYMAPEQFDAKQVDNRSDLYAVGAVIYEMLTGQRPFHGDTVVQIMKAQLMHTPEAPHLVNPEVPEDLSKVVMKSLEKPPELRYQSASEMRQALYDAVGGQAPALPERPSAAPVSLQERLNAAKNASSETLVMAPKKTGGTIEIARATLGEVSDDFRLGFHTVAWSKFSLNWMPRLVGGLMIYYIVTLPDLGLLGKTAVALTYTDFWMLGWLAFNLLFSLMAFVRFVRRERLYRQLVACGLCLISWVFWASQYAQRQDTPYQFGLHAKSYFVRLSKSKPG